MQSDWLSAKSPAIMHISSGLCKQSRQRQGDGDGMWRQRGEGVEVSQRVGECYKLQRMREKRKRGPNPQLQPLAICLIRGKQGMPWLPLEDR